MRKLFAIVTAAIALSGCETAEHRAAYEAAYQAAVVRGREVMAQTRDNNDNKRCLDFGTQPGTDGYTQCRLKLMQLHQEADEAEDAEESRTAEINAQQQAAARQQQQDNYDQQMANIRAVGQMYHPAAPPTSMNCTTSYVSSYAYTNCQ